MGRYATLAEEHWRATRPADYQALTDQQRARLFGEMEQEARRQIDATLAAMPQPPEEPFPDRAARLAAQRQMAEEIVLADLLSPPPAEEPVDPASGVPLPEESPDRLDRQIAAALTDFQTAAREWQATAPPPPEPTSPTPDSPTPPA